MTRKRRTAAERLRQEIERVRITRQLHKLIQQPISDFENEKLRAAYANVALNLDMEPPRSPLRKAFQQFELDPRDPFSWRLLLSTLAVCFFPRPHPRGARPKWNERRRLLFKTDVARARRLLKQLAATAGDPSPTDDLVADYLRYKWPDRYPQDATSLRRYIASGPPRGRR